MLSNSTKISKKTPLQKISLEKKIDPHKSVRSILSKNPELVPFNPRSKPATEFELMKSVMKEKHVIRPSLRTLTVSQTTDADQREKVALVKQILQKSPPINSLNITFEKSRWRKDHEFFLVIPALRNGELLRHLTIESNEFTSKEIQTISQNLGQLSNLQTLRIHSYSMNNVDDEAFEMLSKNIMKLRNLQSLSLNLFLWKMNPKSPNFALLAKIFEHLPLLKDLHLAFQHWGNITQSLETMIKNPLCLKSLKTLSLNIYKVNKDKSNKWFNLLQGLAQSLNLEHLKLNFSDCTNLYAEAMSGILQNLVRFSGLQSLELDFSRTRFTDALVEEAIAVVKKLKGMKEIRLKTNGCDFVSKKAVLAWEKFCRVYKMENSAENTNQFPKRG